MAGAPGYADIEVGVSSQQGVYGVMELSGKCLG